MKRFTLFAVAVAALIAAPAVAQENAFYAGVSAGQAKVKDFCAGAGSMGISCKDTSSAWRLYGGREFPRGLAIEASYADLGSVDASAGKLRASVNARVFDLSGIVSVPVGVFRAFGKLGVYNAQTKADSNFGFADSKSNTGLTYGAGLRYHFSPTVGARTEWQRYQKMGGGNIGEANIDTFSAGVFVRF